MRAWHAVQNSNTNYTHEETLQSENNNKDYKQFISQEIPRARPTLHILARARTRASHHMGGGGGGGGVVVVGFKQLVLQSGFKCSG